MNFPSADVLRRRLSKEQHSQVPLTAIAYGRDLAIESSGKICEMKCGLDIRDLTVKLAEVAPREVPVLQFVLGESAGEQILVRDEPKRKAPRLLEDADRPVRRFPQHFSD